MLRQNQEETMMKSGQFRSMAIATTLLLTIGMGGCSNPVAECNQLKDKAGVAIGSVIALGVAAKSPVNTATDATIEIAVQKGTVTDQPALETAIKDIESVSVSNAEAKDLQTRYVAALKDLHQAALDWKDPAKQKAAMATLKQKAPEAQALHVKIAGLSCSP
jgi:hypothetical protein